MVEEHSFRIDPYINLSEDWARTPDGSFYSNKAPGPVFLALPLFWAVDKFVTLGATNRAERVERRESARWMVLKLLSYCTQVIPLVVVWVLLLTQLKASNLSNWLASLLVFLGCTTSLFMNCFFGHGLAAVALLLGVWALFKRRYAWAGLGVGLAVLSDYGCALLLLPLMGYFLFQRPNLKSFGWLLLGAALPIALWGWYHTSCFGGWFALPQKFQNPTFVGDSQVWGVVNLAPNMDAVWHLVHGSVRGLLFTNPWIFALLLADWTTAKKSSEQWAFSLVCWIGFALMFWMNASFNGWHGGSSPGPRYLAPVLPLFGVLILKRFDQYLAVWKIVLGVTIAVAVCFNLMVFVTGQVPPLGFPLWDYYLAALADPSDTTLLRSGLLILLVVMSIWRLKTARSKVSFWRRPSEN